MLLPKVNNHCKWLINIFIKKSLDEISKLFSFTVAMYNLTSNVLYVSR
jgi:hypothetical protein